MEWWSLGKLKVEPPCNLAFIFTVDDFGCAINLGGERRSCTFFRYWFYGLQYKPIMGIASPKSVLQRHHIFPNSKRLPYFGDFLKFCRYVTFFSPYTKKVKLGSITNWASATSKLRKWFSAKPTPLGVGQKSLGLRR